MSFNPAKAYRWLDSTALELTRTTPEHMDAAVEWPSIERRARLHFGALTDIRVDSDACDNDSCCLFSYQGHVVFDVFSPLSQLAFGQASTYKGRAADVDLTVPEACCFSWQCTSISNSHLDLLLISTCPIAQRREAYIYNSKNERFFSASIGQLHVIVGAPKEALRHSHSGQCARPAPGIPLRQKVPVPSSYPGRCRRLLAMQVCLFAPTEQLVQAGQGNACQDSSEGHKAIQRLLDSPRNKRPETIW